MTAQSPESKKIPLKEAIAQLADSVGEKFTLILGDSDTEVDELFVRPDGSLMSITQRLNLVAKILRGRLLVSEPVKGVEGVKRTLPVTIKEGNSHE